MRTPFAFAFVLASLVLSGCDFINPGADGPAAAVTSITFDQLPLAQRNGEPWDEDGAPDVYLEIQDALGRVYVDSQAPTEITEAGTRVAVDGAIRNFDRDYFFFVVDMDEGENQNIGNISRLSFQEVAEQRLSSVSFENDDASLRVTLDLEWSEE